MALLFCLGAAQVNLDALNNRFLARDLHTETDIFRLNLFVPVFDSPRDSVKKVPFEATSPNPLTLLATRRAPMSTMADVSYTKTLNLERSLDQG